MKTRKCLILLLVLIVLPIGSMFCTPTPKSDSSTAATQAAMKATETAIARAITHITQLASGLPNTPPLPTETMPPTVALFATIPPVPSAITSPTIAPPSSTIPPMPEPQTCSSESEPFWHWQAGVIYINNFFFTTSSTGFAIGEPYTLLRTDDGGNTWRVWPIPSSAILEAIYFSNPLVGWVAGDAGTILKTEDGGFTWQTEQSDTNAHLYVIKFRNDQVGWAGGSNGTLLRTTDGGVNWSAGATGEQFVITDISFVNATEGYLVGSNGPLGYVLQSNDGGVTWQNTDYWGSVPETVYAAEGRTTWLAGGWVAGTIWKGIGHDSQTSVLSDVFPSSCGGTGYHFRQILFSDEQHGWVVGDCGLAIFTQDGGDNWQPMGVDEHANWKMLRFTSENEVVLAGYDYNQAGIQITHSSDGGITWSPASPGGISAYAGIAAMDFVDPLFGWFVAENNNQPTTLFSTNDGGQTWGKHKLSIGRISKIEFVDRLRGWLIGDTGLVARTDDGGQNWNVQPVRFPETWQSISFVDRDHGWIISAKTGTGSCQERPIPPEHLTLFRTSSGGDIWEGPICIEMPSSPGATLMEYHQPPHIRFVDQKTGWIVGDLGLILKTTDGGLTWQVQNSEVSVSLTDVYFMDAKAGWVTGAGGVLLATKDGGLNWKQQRLGNQELTSVRFLEETGWVLAIGDPGLYYTEDGGRTWEGSSIRFPYQGARSYLDVVDKNHVWGGAESGIGSYSPVCLTPPP